LSPAFFIECGKDVCDLTSATINCHCTQAFKGCHPTRTLSHQLQKKEKTISDLKSQLGKLQANVSYLESLLSDEQNIL
jgi:peptidoglycan hydrolase CwlO-like protein